MDIRCLYSHAFCKLAFGSALTTASIGLTALAGVPQAAAASSGTTTANVAVGSEIALSALTPSFTLSGLPGESPETDYVVGMKVDTNNATGYTVTVTAAGNLTGTGANTTTIPVNDLQFRESGTANPFTGLATTPQTAHTQTTPSITGGDQVSTDYRITIPTVPTDTYTTTLTYTATTNP